MNLKRLLARLDRMLTKESAERFKILKLFLTFNKVNFYCFNYRTTKLETRCRSSKTCSFGRFQISKAGKNAFFQMRGNCTNFSRILFFKEIHVTSQFCKKSSYFLSAFYLKLSAIQSFTQFFQKFLRT